MSLGEKGVNFERFFRWLRDDSKFGKQSIAGLFHLARMQYDHLPARPRDCEDWPRPLAVDVFVPNWALGDIGGYKGMLFRPVYEPTWYTRRFTIHFVNWNSEIRLTQDHVHYQHILDDIVYSQGVRPCNRLDTQRPFCIWQGTRRFQADILKNLQGGLDGFRAEQREEDDGVFVVYIHKDMQSSKGIFLYYTPDTVEKVCCCLPRGMALASSTACVCYAVSECHITRGRLYPPLPSLDVGGVHRRGCIYGKRSRPRDKS